jgi:hypothetical protein
MHRFLLAGAVVFTAGALSLSAQQPATAAARAAAGATRQRSATPSILPGTPESTFALIQGNALSATNSHLASVSVRLREVRYGRIVDTQLTDRAGLFAFRVVDPGNYVVELVGSNESVLAASQVVNINAGEAVSVVVQLPFRGESFVEHLGHAVPQVLAVLSAAAASGVLAESVAATGAQDISPR